MRPASLASRTGWSRPTRRRQPWSTKLGASSRTAKGRQRFDPLRATALLFIAAGILLIVSFFYVNSVAVADQQRLDQEWRQHVTVPQAVPPRIDPALQQPVNGVDFAIQVPKLNYFAAVREGVSSGVLYGGPGHYPETPWPGDLGTVGVAAHNVYWINFP